MFGTASLAAPTRMGRLDFPLVWSGVLWSGVHGVRWAGFKWACVTPLRDAIESHRLHHATAIPGMTVDNGRRWLIMSVVGHPCSVPQ